MLGAFPDACGSCSVLLCDAFLEMTFSRRKSLVVNSRKFGTDATFEEGERFIGLADADFEDGGCWDTSDGATDLVRCL
jgi:hypothetical protein